MKKNLIFLSLIVFLITSLVVFAAPPKKVKAIKAPYNPEFVEYVINKEFLDITNMANFDARTVRVPSPVDLSHTRGAQIAGIKAANGYPNYFNLQDQGKVTGIRDQGSCGGCWAFAALASMESRLLPGADWDFSEEDMVVNHGLDWGPCDGGNEFMATAYLARWSGPLSENDVPYQHIAGGTQGTQTSDNAALIKKHVQQVVYLPDRANALDNDAIKYFLTNIGAVTTAIHMDEVSNFFNNGTDAYYCNVNAQTNHDVTIVGWNDDYSASNFTIAPPGPGAFICKNSWGTNFGNNGYFYVSYYDQTISRQVSYEGIGGTSNYGTNYGYDELGWVGSFGYGDTNAWCANVFMATNNQPLTAVGFYTVDVNTSYEVYVYKGVVGNDPRTGTLMATQTGAFPFSGFYTVSLNNQVPLTTGETFSVVIRFKTTSYPYPIPCEFPADDYSSTAYANNGESYISYDGVAWEELSNSQEQINACIRAFSSYKGVSVDLNAAKITYRSWLISKTFPQVTVSISNPNNVSLSEVYIFRRDSFLQPFTIWKKVSISEFQNGSYSCTDSMMEEGKTYYYKASAINASGSFCGGTGEKTLN